MFTRYQQATKGNRKAMLRLLTLPWRITKWFGRVCLWLVFWPLGLWRSIVHGQAKRAR